MIATLVISLGGVLLVLIVVLVLAMLLRSGRL